MTTRCSVAMAAASRVLGNVTDIWTAMTARTRLTVVLSNALFTAF